ncbi:hypothetical protein CBL_03997 [Carabus blaptoides fortunei]
MQLCVTSLCQFYFIETTTGENEDQTPRVRAANNRYVVLQLGYSSKEMKRVFLKSLLFSLHTSSCVPLSSQMKAARAQIQAPVRNGQSPRYTWQLPLADTAAPTDGRGPCLNYHSTLRRSPFSPSNTTPPMLTAFVQAKVPFQNPV